MTHKRFERTLYGFTLAVLLLGGISLANVLAKNKKLETVWVGKRWHLVEIDPTVPHGLSHRNCPVCLSEARK
jgi:hypothetical protein